MAHVWYDANDARDRVAARQPVADREAVSQRRRAGEELSRRRFVDDDHRLGAFAIGRFKGTACHERNVERGEETFADLLRAHHRLVVVRDGWSGVYSRDAIEIVTAAQWRAG